MDCRHPIEPYRVRRLKSRLLFTPRLLLATSTARHMAAEARREMLMRERVARAAFHSTIQVAKARSRRVRMHALKASLLDVRSTMATSSQMDCLMATSARGRLASERVIMAALRRSDARVKTLQCAGNAVSEELHQQAALKRALFDSKDPPPPLLQRVELAHAALTTRINEEATTLRVAEAMVEMAIKQAVHDAEVEDAAALSIARDFVTQAMQLAVAQVELERMIRMANEEQGDERASGSSAVMITTPCSVGLVIVGRSAQIHQLPAPVPAPSLHPLLTEDIAWPCSEALLDTLGDLSDGWDHVSDFDCLSDIESSSSLDTELAIDL